MAPPAAAIHPQRPAQAAQRRQGFEPLHQVEVFHQRQRPHPAGPLQQRARQQQPLVAVGELPQPAAQRHRRLQQPQRRPAPGHRQIEIPGGRGLPQGPLHHRCPIGRQATIAVQQQQPGSRCGGNAALQLPSAVGGAVQHRGAGQLGQCSSAITAAPIHHHPLRHQARRGQGQVGQQHGQVLGLVAHRNHHRQGGPCAHDQRLGSLLIGSWARGLWAPSRSVLIVRHTESIGTQKLLPSLSKGFST